MKGQFSSVQFSFFAVPPRSLHHRLKGRLRSPRSTQGPACPSADRALCVLRRVDFVTLRITLPRCVGGAPHGYRQQSATRHARETRLKGASRAIAQNCSRDASCRAPHGRKGPEIHDVSVNCDVLVTPHKGNSRLVKRQSIRSIPHPELRLTDFTFTLYTDARLV